MATHLKSQHLAEVLSILLAAPPVNSGAEKRRATRIQVEAPVTIWPVKEGSHGTPATVLTRDISYSGIGILQARPAATDDQFILRLPRPKAEPILLLCQVTYVKTLADNLYGVGALYVSVLEKSKEPRVEISMPKLAEAMKQTPAAVPA